METPRWMRENHTEGAIGRGNILKGAASALEDVEDVFEFYPQLADDLLALIDVNFGLFTGELLAGAPDGEAMLVEEASDLTDENDVLALVIAAITAPLEGFETGKLLFPVSQHVRLDAAEVTHFTDREVAFARNGWQLDATYRRFQHRPLPAL